MNKTKGADSLPLVSLVFFAYNQERHIRETVEGAFAQTYLPLEIILSDDWSTDSTYRIMADMTGAYGRHRFLVLK